MLIAMAGLQGTGKSFLSDRLAQRMGATIIAVDTIEFAMTRAGLWHSKATGTAAYYAAEAVARGNLEAGRDVIVDAANSAHQTRTIWMSLADEVGTDVVFLLTVCSDQREHRRRIATGHRDLPGSREISWDDVVRRNMETECWGREPRVAVDTAREVDLDHVVSLVRSFCGHQDGIAADPGPVAARRASL